MSKVEIFSRRSAFATLHAPGNSDDKPFTESDGQKLKCEVHLETWTRLDACLTNICHNQCRDENCDGIIRWVPPVRWVAQDEGAECFSEQPKKLKIISTHCRMKPGDSWLIQQPRYMKLTGSHIHLRKK